MVKLLSIFFYIVVLNIVSQSNCRSTVNFILINFFLHKRHKFA